MPKPKKGEIYGTFNNEMAFETGLAKLRKIQGIDVQPLDSHTIKILLKKRDDSLEDAVNNAIRTSKGYVEIDLDTINAIQSGKERKQKQESGVLDTPFYG
jgi:hypothetical protein